MTRRHSPGRPPRSDGEADAAGRPDRLTDLREHRTRVADRRRSRRRSYRRAVVVGLAVSAALHALAVAFLSDQLRLPRMRSEAPPSAEEALRGTRLVQTDQPVEPEIPPSPQQTIEPPPPPRPRQQEQQQEDAPEAEGQPEAGREEPAPEGEGMSNAERLEPREGDPRVWREFWDENPRRYLGGSARADSAIRAILGKYFDSLRVAREAYEDARDWTFGEGDERWGVSPDGIHLGDITIPIPVNQLLSPTGPKRRQLERELRALRQIQRQETLRQAAETREERIEEMRERSREQADSDSTENDSGGGG